MFFPGNNRLLTANTLICGSGTWNSSVRAAEAAAVI